MINNWQHLCIFGRLASKLITTHDVVTIHHDNKNINVHRRADDCIMYIDADTGEVLLVQGEDGFPVYYSEWAQKTPTMPYQIA